MTDTSPADEILAAVEKTTIMRTVSEDDARNYLGNLLSFAANDIELSKSRGLPIHPLTTQALTIARAINGTQEQQ